MAQTKVHHKDAEHARAVAEQYGVETARNRLGENDPAMREELQRRAKVKDARKKALEGMRAEDAAAKAGSRLATKKLDPKAKAGRPTADELRRRTQEHQKKAQETARQAQANAQSRGQGQGM